MREYYNIKNEGFFNRNRPEKVIFNPKTSQELLNIKNWDLKKLRELEGETLFFTIPKWLMESKNMKSIYLTGKITEITAKAIQFNFSNDNWFPLSQMNKVYLYIRKKPIQKLLTEYEQKENNLVEVNLNDI